MPDMSNKLDVLTVSSMRFLAIALLQADTCLQRTADKAALLVIECLLLGATASPGKEHSQRCKSTGNQEDCQIQNPQADWCCSAGISGKHQIHKTIHKTLEGHNCKTR